MPIRSERPNEILVLRRLRGYLRFFIPPLLYSPACASQLEKGIVSLPGVRKVIIRKKSGKLSVYFDPLFVAERQIFREVEKIAVPLLSTVSEEKYALIIRRYQKDKTKELLYRGVNVLLLAYLVNVHWYLLKRWVRNPVKHTLPLAAIGTLMLLHKKQLKNATTLD